MYWVYVIYSPASDKIYIGYTSDLDARLKSHNELAKKGWTLKFRPWSLIHTEMFQDKSQAIRREGALKSSQRRAFI